MFIIAYLRSRESDDAVEVITSPTPDLDKAVATAKARVNLFAGASEGKGLMGFSIENEAGDQVYRWFREAGDSRDFR